ncbi:MAG TPA: diguanylate cyclase [Capillimicrobium sp.]|nr:diguanylate cyclase [Capillimicrobium sp.]
MPCGARDIPTADEAFDHAPAGMAILTIDGRLLRVNRALCELLGYDEAELLARNAGDLVAADGRPGPRVRDLARGHAARVTVDRRLLTASGQAIWVSVAVAVLRDADGEPRALVAQLHDVSERKRLEDALRHAADHDVLTGLRNRRRFEADLAHRIELCRRYGERAAVVLLDLDRLKEVNDTDGHLAGDRLLVAVARILERRLRASDTLARLGGDEFAAILPHVRPSAALTVAETLVRAVADEAPAGCTASAGVVVIAGDAADASAVMAAADRAMYAAKRGGRDRAVLA